LFFSTTLGPPFVDSQSSGEHALAAINVFEALEDAQEYIAAGLPDDIREQLGI
jgi:hypothetical protein